MYPVTFTADYVAERSRLTTFFRGLMVIPLLIAAIFWGIAACLALIAAWFAMVVTGRYPAGLYSFNAQAIRFLTRVNAYHYLLTDAYPPFTGEDDPDYPVRVSIAPPAESYSRLKAFFRYIVGIPVWIMQYLWTLVAAFVGLVSWVVIVVTGKQPAGLQDLLRMAMSYHVKALAYLFLITERYPPVTDRSELEPGGAPSPSLG